MSFLASRMGTWFKISGNTEISAFALLSDDFILLGLKIRAFFAILSTFRSLIKVETLEIV